jgi:ribokinase
MSAERDRAVFEVIVVGGLNTDFVGVGNGLPRPGETLNGTVFHETAGGKGANQAVAVARLGGRVALVGAVGTDDRGEALLKRLAGERVDVQFVRKHAGIPTGAALIHVDARGEKQILAVLGANCRPAPADITAACDAIGRSRVLLTQFELPIEAVFAALRWARANGVRTVLDPAPAAVSVPDDLLRVVDVLKPNAHEAEALTGIEVTDRRSAARAAAALLARGVGAVAIQAGGEGNLLVSPEEERFFARLPVKTVDATGAGDAFAATLATYLARGRTLMEAGRFANAAAAHATTVLGAQEGLPTEAELQALLSRPPGS